MRFNFVLSRDAQAGDQVDDVRDQIEAAGHEFVLSRGQFAPPPAVNIFSEGTTEASAAAITELAKSGHRIVCLLTEEPTLISNGGLVWNYRTDEPNWFGRAREFVAMVPHLAACWCYAPGSAAKISHLLPAADIDIGYGKRFALPRPVVEPTFDFCFFGGLTDRRGVVIDRFRRRGHTVDVIPHSTSLADRDARIPRSRVVIDARQYEWWRLVSSVRYATAIMCGRPAVAEYRVPEARVNWDRIVAFAPEDTFDSLYATATKVLAGWKREHARQLKALRERRTSLDAAITLVPPQRPWIRVTHLTKVFDASAIAQPPAPGPDDFAVPHLVGEVRTVNLVHWRGSVWTVPQGLGQRHLNEMVGRPDCPISVRCYKTVADATRAVTAGLR